MKHVKAAKATEICEHYDLDKKARPLLRPDATPREFLEALRADGQHQAAVSFLAHALPPREAIWWGCLCLQKAAGAGLPEGEAAAFRASAAWVLDPTEENRHAAEQAAAAAGKGTAAELLAVGVGWTGGSLAPPLPPSLPDRTFPRRASTARSSSPRRTPRRSPCRRRWGSSSGSASTSRKDGFPGPPT